MASSEVDVCFLQETKCEHVTELMVRDIWGGNSNFEWLANPSIGAAEGLLTIWKKECFQLIFSFMGEGFLGIGFDW